MSAGPDPAADPTTAPGRLAEMRRARAERAARLARLRGGSAEPGSERPAEDTAALAAFLRVLRAAAAEDPLGVLPASAPAPAPPAGDAAPAAAVLRFLRAPDRGADRAPARPAGQGDLDRLPGVGPGLVWALERAGIARLAELAEAAPEALADRLGPIGGLVDLAAWIGFARDAVPPRDRG